MHRSNNFIRQPFFAQKNPVLKAFNDTDHYSVRRCRSQDSAATVRTVPFSCNSPTSIIHKQEAKMPKLNPSVSGLSILMSLALGLWELYFFFFGGRWEGPLGWLRRIGWASI